jgi:hypothetical protein
MENMEPLEMEESRNPSNYLIFQQEMEETEMEETDVEETDVAVIASD